MAPIGKLATAWTDTPTVLATFIDSLDLPDEAKVALRTMTPASYTGNAAYQAKNIRD